MIVVNKKQTMLIDGKLVTEASSLQLPPGVWPYFISVVDDAGEGFLFEQKDKGDWGSRYSSALGGDEELVVYND